MYIRNVTYRAIRTWKNHFDTELCSTDTRFPMHLWDCLIVQATITLNLLRLSSWNPKILVYNMLEGTFDSNKTPMTPPWHEGKNSRKSATTPNLGSPWHRRLVSRTCHGTLSLILVFTYKTKAERIMDAVELFPQHTNKVPTMTMDKITIQSAEDLLAAINQPTNQPPKLLPCQSATNFRGCLQNNLHHFPGWQHSPDSQQSPLVTRIETTTATCLQRINTLHDSNRHHNMNKLIMSSPSKMTQIALKPQIFQHMCIGPMPLLIPAPVPRWNTDTFSKVQNIAKHGQCPLQMNLDNFHMGDR
jgi:hypothetical protein